MKIWKNQNKDAHKKHMTILAYSCFTKGNIITSSSFFIHAAMKHNAQYAIYANFKYSKKISKEIYNKEYVHIWCRLKVGLFFNYSLNFVLMTSFQPKLKMLQISHLSSLLQTYFFSCNL